MDNARYHPLCEICGATFSRAYTLHRHQRRVHGLQDIRCQPAVTRRAEEPQLTDVERLMGLCEGCNRVFATRSSMIRHRRRGACAAVAPPPEPQPLVPSDRPCIEHGISPSPSPPPTHRPRAEHDISPSPSPPPPSHHSAQSPAGTSSSDEENDGKIPSGLATDFFIEYETGFRSRLKTYHLAKAPSSEYTIPDFFCLIFDNVVELLRNICHHVRNVKVNIRLECEFIKDVERCRRAFKTMNTEISCSTDLDDMCGTVFQKLVDEKEACEMKGSGWSFARILDMEIRVNLYRPLGGSSFIPLPQKIKDKKAVKNVLNDADNECFRYAMLTRNVHNPHREQLRPNAFTPEVHAEANLDFTGLVYPVQIGQIDMFEKKNDISVNVYGLVNEGKEKNVVYPLRITREEKERHYDLLYLTNERTTHYAYITDLERQIHRQKNKHDGQIYVCKRCFAHFDKRKNVLGLDGKTRLREHLKYCKEHAPVRTELSKDLKIEFKKPQCTQRVRFTVYADFECALVPFNEDKPLKPPPTVPAPDWETATDRGELPHHHHRSEGPASACVEVKSVHKPYAYSYYVRDAQQTSPTGEGDEGDTSKFTALRTYRGENAARHFMETIKQDVRNIEDVLYAYRRLAPRLTSQQELEFRAATVCHICSKEFTRKNFKVRDHQHSAPYTYRGAAHRSCNIDNREQTVVTCYLHNLSNYDAHFIVRELHVDNGEVRVLANTEEKYITIRKTFAVRAGAGSRRGMTLRFVDTYRFLARALADLVSMTPPEQLPTTAAYFPDSEQFDLVRRKGVFPYEYVKSMEVLDETELPTADKFYNSLRMEHIKTEEYEHAQNVWHKFGCTTLGEYADLYLKTDVLLLSDVFESFRNMCMTHYGLDPAHWLTLPSYAWDVMLLKTEVKLDTVQDVDMFLLFEKGIRGGLVQCSRRHALVDNKYVRGDSGSSSSSSGAEKLEEYLMYYDTNNLYGWAMSQQLPHYDFEWMSREAIDDLDIMGIPEDDEYGYVLEVDLMYPVSIHDRHRDLPFLPEVIRAPADQLPYSQDILKCSSAGRNKKLMATLLDKKGYVLHHTYLQQALKNGLVLQRIHRVIRFKQSKWLKKYVDLNTDLRKKPANKFEMELFKLMNNAVYGMCLQNVRKHIDIRIVSDPAKYIKLVAKSNFSDRTWYNENLALLHMAKVKVVLEKPVYAGMCILDHSKRWMYAFHTRMQDRYPGRLDLMYSDTDSLIYLIRSTDVYKDMITYRDDFDTSNYPEGHPCYNSENEKVLGKFKDEAGGQALKEFIGLMSKLYCIVFAGDEDSAPPPVKKVKGVNRAVVKHTITPDDYRTCLKKQRILHTNNPRFETHRHIVYTVNTRKQSMGPFDDKRYIMEDGITTLPWGHYRIPYPQVQSPAASLMEVE